MSRAYNVRAERRRQLRSQRKNERRAFVPLPTLRERFYNFVRRIVNCVF